MNCIVVDDEPLAREGMELNIQDVPSLTLLGMFGSAMEANDFIRKNKVDLLFLDIQMPGITGLEYLRNLKDAPMVILTTAYPQYALESFELNVLDYLVKPIRLERFIKAVNKAQDQYDLLKNNQTENKIESIEDEFVYLKSERKFIKVFFKDIKYIKGVKDYVMLVTKDTKILTAMNIKTIYNQLPDSIFARVNKSYVINTQYINSVELDCIQLGGEEIPLGRTYKDDFLKKHIKSNLLGRK